jgi:hypothetical protein
VEISELAVAVGQEVGFQPDTSNTDKDKDNHSFYAKKALEDIKRIYMKMISQYIIKISNSKVKESN